MSQIKFEPLGSPLNFAQICFTNIPAAQVATIAKQIVVSIQAPLNPA